MSEFDNTNQVVVSRVVSEHPDAPTMRIRVELAGGVKMESGLWPMTRKDGSVVKDRNGHTLYRGKLEPDDWDPQQSEPRSQPPDDDIPF